MHSWNIHFKGLRQCEDYYVSQRLKFNGMNRCTEIFLHPWTFSIKRVTDRTPTSIVNPFAYGMAYTNHVKACPSNPHLPVQKLLSEKQPVLGQFQFQLT